jgi:hypothetical protein
VIFISGMKAGADIVGGDTAISIEFSLGVSKRFLCFWILHLFGRFHDERSDLCQCSVDLLNEFGWCWVRNEKT